MDCTSNISLLEVTRAQMMAARRACNVDTEQLNDDLDKLETWCRSQDHLVAAFPYLGRDMLERFLIKSKGSLERTKQAIDKALAVRGMVPDIIIHEKPNTIINKFYHLLDNILITSLPKANPEDGTRVILLRLMNKDFEDIDVRECAKFGTFFTDVRMAHDYIFSDRIIFDFQYCKPSIITKLNPIILKKMQIFFIGAYKFRVKGIHVINAPSFFDKLFFIAKGFFPEKMFKRIHIHSSYEELYKLISKEILPKEYGGEGMSFSKLVEEWKKYIQSDDAQCIMENCHRLVSDVSKRTSSKFDEEYFGLPGSFKRINID